MFTEPNEATAVATLTLPNVRTQCGAFIRLLRKMFGRFRQPFSARAAPLASACIGWFASRNRNGAGTGTETADELTRVNNHRPSIFLASPSRSTWLLAVQFGRPVAGFNDTSK